MRSFHNIQETEKVEEIGGKIPRIYAILEKGNQNINS
jgi:hypothetical protein